MTGAKGRTLSMVLTIQQQTSILRLVLALFRTAPGAANMTILGSQLLNGQSLPNLAQSLAQSALFFDKHYRAQLSHAEFAASFINDLVGNRTSESDKNLLIDFVTHKQTSGASQNEIIAEVTSALSSVSFSDSNWGKASLHYTTHNVSRVVNYLFDDTFSTANKSVVVDHILTQISAGKTFGDMVVWVVDTVAGVDHDNVVWGNAAVLLNNRTEVARYYSIDRAGIAIDREVLQKILAKVTTDVRTIVTAKATIDNLLSDGSIFSRHTNRDFRLDEALKIQNSNVSSMPKGKTKSVELVI